MTRSLVVAPQWIGDAVMAEPLLATLAEGGDVLTLPPQPTIAPLNQAKTQNAENLELKN